MYQPNYLITDKLLNTIAQIESIRSRVDTSYILPERETEMRYRATVEATHSSTSIEGNPLNIKQVEKVLSEKEPRLTRHQYAEIEVRNYKKALDFVDKRKSAGEKLDATDILKIHKIVADRLIDEPEKIGAWRNNLVYITDGNDQALYNAPAAEMVPREVEELLNWLNGASYDIHPVIAAAILHFQFVSIHPFADGNGRTTRLLTALYLGLRNYDFRSALVLDSYYSTDKASYYAALHCVQGDNYKIAKVAQLNPWLDYFSDGFLSSAKVLSAEVTLLSSAIQQLPKPHKLSRDETDLLSYIQQFGSIALSEAESILPHASRRTVQRRLKGLVDNGYLVAEGSTNTAAYQIKRLR
ncbi:MAG: Fic family protein [Actinomycetia bacterium]|nr:Fic family protein [Actinomycetes bacterium]